MGYSLWDCKALDTTEQLNNNVPEKGGIEENKWFRELRSVGLSRSMG